MQYPATTGQRRPTYTPRRLEAYTPLRLPGWVGYAIAVLLTALLTLWLHLIEKAIPLGNYPVMYTLLIALVAYFLGQGPAILAFLIGLLAFSYYFVPPVHQLFPYARDASGWASLAAYVIGALTIAAAMTLIRRSRESLRQTAIEAERSRAQLDAVFQAMTDSIVVTDMQGHFVLSNHPSTSVGAMATPEEMQRDMGYFQTIFELCDREGRVLPNEEWPMRRIIHGESFANLELLGRRKDTGQSRFFSFSGEPVYDEHGKQILAVFISRDITEAKQAEESLRKLTDELEQRVRDRTEQLVAANKELEAFSYSVSHDLRAPLRIVDGFSLALLEDYGDKLDDQGKKYLRFLRDAAQRMAQLIDDILRLSRIGRAEMRYTQVDLSTIASGVADSLGQLQPERRVVATIEPGMTVCGDADLLRIVLDNLLGNAWKYTSHVPDARITFGVTVQDGERVYYVRDNGAGFNMAYADRLFAPFQRLHTEAEFPGTGIGLTIVRRIITRHGGRVWAEGGENKGATFYFTLPTEGRCA